VKRVAAAVGEGAQVVAALHSFLTTTKAIGTTDIKPSTREVESVVNELWSLKQGRLVPHGRIRRRHV
jgi:hypothetical protein